MRPSSRRDIRNLQNLPIRFVEKAELPAATTYEACIDSSGKVPTCDNLHDFLNALIWLAFSSIKVQLNALQAAERVFTLEDGPQFTWIDRYVTAEVALRGSPVGRLTQLPVLGVPGWSHLQDRAFYADTAVFRPKRDA